MFGEDMKVGCDNIFLLVSDGEGWLLPVILFFSRMSTKNILFGLVYSAKTFI